MGERVVRRLAAILAADVAGYSRLMGRDEHGTLTRLKGTSKNTPVNDGLAMDADVLWFRRGFVGAGSTFWAS